MKIHIPEFQAMAKCNEHMNHGPIDIDLGPDVVPVVRCRECKYHKPIDYCTKHKQTGWFDDDFCSRGQSKGAEHE